MESDLTDVINTAIDGNLSTLEITWKSGASACVTAASKGYPGNYETGFEITGIEKADAKVYIAGAVEKDGKLLTTGGRVLNVVALGETLETAREKAYKEIVDVNLMVYIIEKILG